MGGRSTIRVAARAGLATAALVIAAPGDTSAERPAAGPWSPTGAMAAGRYDPPVARLANGHVLVIGEDDKSEELTSQIYDPVSRTWSTGPGLARRSRRWTLVLLDEGGALLIGAAACSQRRYVPVCLPTSDTYRLSVDERAWVPAARMLEARAGPVAVPLRDGTVFVAGGFGDGCMAVGATGYSCRPTASSEIYDPRTETSSPRPPMPSPRPGAVGTLISDGTVLLVGGRSPSPDSLRYSPQLATWTMLRPSVFDHTGGTLVPLPGDRVIAFGEGGGDASYEFGVVVLTAPRPFGECDASPEVYVAKTDTWGPVPPFPGGSFSCSADAVPLGGEVLYDGRSGFQLLDRNLLCWVPVPAPAIDLGELVALSDGSALYLAGQALLRAPFSSAETLAAPSPPSCPGSARTREQIFSQLQLFGPRSSLGRVLESGYRMQLRLPTAGSLVVRWYIREGRPTPPSHRPLLVAAGHAVARRAGRVGLTMRLTAHGRSTFEQQGLVRLNALAIYAPPNASPVSVVRSFNLMT